MIRRDPFEPNPVYSLRETLLGVGLLFGLVFGLIVAASYPTATATALGATVTTAGTGWIVLALRRRFGLSRTICIPHTGVCIRA